MRLLAPDGPSHFVCPIPFRRSVPPVTNSHIAETGHKNIAILLEVKGIAMFISKSFAILEVRNHNIDSTFLTWQR